MKHSILIGAALLALALAPTTAAMAMPLGSLTPVASEANADTVLVMRGGRGHHYGWGRGRARGHNYGWSRGRHHGRR